MSPALSSPALPSNHSPMKLSQALRHAVRRALAARGYLIVNLNADQARMSNAQRAIGRRHPGINTVIDVGASDGRWSDEMLRHLPDAHYLLIEAQAIHRPALSRFATAHPNAQFVLAAAGAEQGQIYFEANDPMGGLASYTPPAANGIVVPVTTIDHEVQERRLPGPFLIKLDTHGFELPILSGAAATLRQTEVVVMECYNFQIAPESLLFDEMCSHMRGLGFRPIDLVDPLHRPFDDALWQIDLVFIRADRPEFQTLQFYK